MFINHQIVVYNEKAIIFIFHFPIHIIKMQMIINWFHYSFQFYLPILYYKKLQIQLNLISIIGFGDILSLHRQIDFNCVSIKSKKEKINFILLSSHYSSLLSFIFLLKSKKWNKFLFLSQSTVHSNFFFFFITQRLHWIIFYHKKFNFHHC